MNSTELRAQAQEISIKARAKLEEGRNNPTVAKDCEAEFDRMMDDADALSARAKRVEEHEARDALINAADERRERTSRNIETGTATMEERHAHAFDTLIRKGGEHALTAEERSLVTRAQSVGVLADGGYAVPTLLHNEIIKAAVTFGPMLDERYFGVIRSDSGAPLNFAVSNSTRKAVIIGEGEAADVVTDKLAQKSMGAYKLTTKAAVASREFLQDAGVDVNAWLAELMADSYGLGANDYLTNGTGSNQPQGIVTALAATAIEAVANTVVTNDERLDLQYAVSAPYRRDGLYMFHSKLEKQLRKAKNAQGDYIWSPSMREGQPDTVFGKGYIINDDMPDIGTSPAGKVAATFGNYKIGYKVRLSRTMGITRLNELYALSDQIGWVGFARLDGKLIQPAAVAALKIKA